MYRAFYSVRLFSSSHSCSQGSLKRGLEKKGSNSITILAITSHLCFFLLRVRKTINRIDLLQRGIINANGSYIFKVIAQDHGLPRRSSEITVEINIVEAGDDSPVFNR